MTTFIQLTEIDNVQPLTIRILIAPSDFTEQS
ncbi:MAG: hypothetical protein CFH37_01388 [Alphaproteobacteria bacterium MarineAlpha9_Bin7]|nr:MAG: hypothetical protein CFH37_01388 [Alphaproteobacteria bacterium MarineAlpha9_Bin7]